MKVRWHTNTGGKKYADQFSKHTAFFAEWSRRTLRKCSVACTRRSTPFKKGEIIFPEGTATEQIGVVLSGRVIIEMGDVWGNNSVLSSIGPGGVFAGGVRLRAGRASDGQRDRRR